MKPCYPIYILHQPIRVIFPEDKQDIGHVEFWENTVCKIVAKDYGIPESRLKNLPYCCQRARIVGDVIYFGENKSDTLIANIMRDTGNPNLKFVYDDHEKRLELDCNEFESLKFQAKIN